MKTKNFKPQQIVYHKFRGKGIFESYCYDNNTSYVLFDKTWGAERVTTSLLMRNKHKK